MNTLVPLYHQAQEYFFTSISSKCIALDESAKAYMTGVPVADLNFVYVIKFPHALHKILIQSQAFYHPEGLSFIVAIPQEFCTSQIKNTLDILGYSSREKTFSLSIQLDKLKTQSAARFKTHGIVRPNDSLLNDWIAPLIDAFGSPFEISSKYITAHERALRKNANLHHFSLYKHERPIASITLSLDDTVARIDDMGTVPEFQRKGYATHLLIYVLSEAKRLGAQYCFLEATDSGLTFYQKIGFEILFENNIYRI